MSGYPNSSGHTLSTLQTILMLLQFVIIAHNEREETALKRSEKMKNNSAFCSSCIKLGIDYRKDVPICRQEAVIWEQLLAYLQWNCKPLQYFAMFTEEILVICSAFANGSGQKMSKSSNNLVCVCHTTLMLNYHSIMHQRIN